MGIAADHRYSKHPPHQWHGGAKHAQRPRRDHGLSRHARASAPWADAPLHGCRNGERGVYQAARIKFGGSSGLMRGTTVKAVICVDALRKS